METAGEKFGERLEKYRNLRMALKRARKATSLESYLSNARVYGLAIGASGFIMGYFVLAFILGLPTLLTILLASLLFPLGAFLGYRLYLWYPSFVVKGRKAKIDDTLPSATAFMYGMSKGGMTVPEIFRFLSERKDDYGEIAVEAASFVREIDCLGGDPLTALHNTARTTPSERFRKFLEYLASVVETGASVSQYLSERCKEYYAEAETEQKRTLESLGFMAEFYVILMLFGPLVAIVSFMALGVTTTGGGMIGGFSILPLYLLAYLLIPVGSIVFMILLSMWSKGVIKEKRFEEPKLFAGVKTETPAERKVLKHLRAEELKPKVLKKPLVAFRESPETILLFSAPAAVISAILGMHGGYADMSTFLFAMLIALVPFVVFYELRARRVGKIVEIMPEFLSSFSSAVSSGLTPAHAIKTIPASELGPLRPGVEKMIRDVNWGKSSVEAMLGFERNARSGLVSRSMTAVRWASEAGEEIGDVLDILATDATAQRSLKRNRWATMLSYVIIVYISFAVFLLSVYMLTVQIMPMVAGTGVTAGVPSVVLHAALLQGFFSGLIAGQFSTGRALSGLKHSIVMMLLAYFVFAPYLV